MVFVNQLAGVSGVPQWARHMKADADAMSFVDVVFPAFLFIVGHVHPVRAGAAPGARRRRRRRCSATCWRARLGLIVLGAVHGQRRGRLQPGRDAVQHRLVVAGAVPVHVPDLGRVRQRGGGRRNTWRAVGVLGLLVLACAYRGGPDGKAWMTHQWWGILGLIGWSYLISASVYLAGRARHRRCCWRRPRRASRPMRCATRSRRTPIRTGPTSPTAAASSARPR